MQGSRQAGRQAGKAIKNSGRSELLPHAAGRPARVPCTHPLASRLISRPPPSGLQGVPALSTLPSARLLRRLNCFSACAVWLAGHRTDGRTDGRPLPQAGWRIAAASVIACLKEILSSNDIELQSSVCHLHPFQPSLLS